MRLSTESSNYPALERTPRELFVVQSIQGIAHACKPNVAGRKCAAKPKQQEQKSTDAERKPRQSDLLDEALLETFPASDSVSIGRVK